MTLDISQFSLVWGDEFDTLSISDSATRDANWSTKGITPAFGSAKLMGAASGVFNIVAKGDSPSVLEIKMRLNASGKLESGIICNVFPDQSSAAAQASPVGYYEARLWLPDPLAGVWPSFWAMSMGRFNPARTFTPELDLMEHYGKPFPNRFATSIHNWRGTGTASDTSRTDVVCDTLCAWHTYGVEIGEDGTQTYYFDRQPYFMLGPFASAGSSNANNGPLDTNTWQSSIGALPFAWMIDFEAGAGWSIDPDLGGAKPAALWVDYFRIYRRVTTSEMIAAGQIADLSTQITSLKGQITQLNARVVNRDGSIRILNEQINKLQAQITALNTANTAFKASINTDLAALATSIGTLQQKLA